jgi:hypothetical protein
LTIHHAAFHATGVICFSLKAERVQAANPDQGNSRMRQIFLPMAAEVHRQRGRR